MQERNSGSSPKEKTPKWARPKYTLVSGLLGGYFGGLSYGITRIFSDNESAQRIGLGVGGGFAAGILGASFSTFSMDEANRYALQGEKAKSRLKVVQAVVEGAAGFGATGAIAGFESKGLASAVIGAGTGVVVGGFGSYLKYKERTKGLSALVIPPGNSVERDTGFPDAKELVQYPPVYRVSSLSDLKEFREVNKRALVKAGSWVSGKADQPDDMGETRFVSAVFIVPNLRHFPAMDPQEDTTLFGKVKERSFDMRLNDTSDNVVAHPCLHSYAFWPYQTIFEDLLGESRYFNDDKWEYWRDRSWDHGVVILAQYQTTGFSRFSGLDPNPKNVIDNYWLLDVLSKEGGVKKRVKERKPKGETVPAYNPQQI